MLSQGRPISRSDRTPVLVGVAALQQHCEDPATAREPLALMQAALEAAADDAGSRELLSRADAIRAPRGFWSYSDPCRALAERFGAAQARTLVSEIGVLQTTLLGGAAQDIAQGRADVVLVTGAEARYRELCGKITGTPTPLTQLPAAEADTVLRPHGEILSRLEIQRGLIMPVGAYAMVENALRAHEGQALDAHARDIAELWAAMSHVAAENPDAWSRKRIDADAVREPVDGNDMLAFPYTKLHNSQWNVDQAAGLILCSLGTARSLGLPPERYVFPLAVADSNHMLPITRKRALHRLPGFAHAGRSVLGHAGLEPAAVEHLELYSCFPVAVRLQLRELGIDPTRQLTVTGGMAFAGGPLNNFVLQAVVKMAQVLRADAGSRGLVTAVSGTLTKVGASLWSTLPGPHGFRFEDVSEATARDVEEVDVVGEALGPARIASYTVLYDDGAPSRAVLLCDLEDGSRALVCATDADLLERLLHEEGCGTPVRLAGATATA